MPFRFYKITRLPSGGQWIDIGPDCDLETMNAEIAVVPLVLDDTVTEFVVYEG